MVSSQELIRKTQEKLELHAFGFKPDEDGILVCYIKETKEDIFFSFGDEYDEEKIKAIIGAKQLDLDEEGFITLSPEEFLSRFSNKEIAELIALSVNGCGDSNCGYEHVCRLICS